VIKTAAAMTGAASCSQRLLAKPLLLV